MPKQVVLFRAEKHWIDVVAGVANLAITIVLTVTVTMVAAKYMMTMISDPTYRSAYAQVIKIGAWFYAIAMIVLDGIPNAVRSLTSEIVLLEDRLIVSWGFLSRHDSTTYLRKIESVRSDRGPLQRLLGIGDVTLIGTGGASSCFRNACSIESLTDRLERQIAKMASAPEVRAA